MAGIADGSVVPLPAERLARVARRAGLREVADAVRLVSHSNDAWAMGDVIVRICWRGDLGRLRREALLLTHLPDAVPHPSVLDFGAAEDLTWMITHRLEGEILFELWDSFGPGQRREAISQLAEALSELHRWQPPPVVSAALDERPEAVSPSASDLVGRFLVPLPVGRIRLLLPCLRGLPHVPDPLVDDLAARLDELQADDPFTGGDRPLVVVHGDAHLRNVLSHHGRVVAVFDFEWSRLAPAELELEALLRHGFADVAELFRWWREAYPGIFDHPNLVNRLRLFELAFLVRQTLAWPPDAALVHRLDRAVASADRIAALVGRDV